MKHIAFSQHSKDQLLDRGTTEEEVCETILSGERLPAKKNRLAFRKNFTYNSKWKEKVYATKQVMPIVVEEENNMVVVTIYVFYFGG